MPPKPEPPEDITKLTDEALKLRIFWADDPRGGESSGPLIDELWRRRRVTEEQLAKTKRNLKIYGGHCGGCPGRPCECGFQAVWMKL